MDISTASMSTPLLELVRLNKEHVPGYFEVWKDPFATRWSSHGPCHTLADAEQWMSELLQDVNPKGENYAVILRSDLDDSVLGSLKQKRQDMHLSADFITPGAFLGWIGTWKSDPVPEVGFILHREAWGLGFATEALTAFVDLFWRVRPEFSILEAWCDTENEASAKVLRKCGFDLVETAYGDYSLSWMTPPLRNSMRFQATREVITDSK
ncbi:GNAT family N-acetyltransferase [Aspergillus clavatus NRRL 1]|uniref:GNAT family acetyltransferase, putative n=1 Tax=Aspergillus clavatus (strain ATCC 1007 / CBS 513.65 / DSM 816 / NCTC 3887 / NRRL 1 / QM 1276 / 107) TaxID=344612 RepID=A1CDY7_ASPCL|nr:GNAT family acetyltransferase, putative [Aspergillus clavatus NRRL 1]EAW12064.1 GNAT family acetyltransferase, putative [Aspergillus clavatus NRRL 1]